MYTLEQRSQLLLPLSPSTKADEQPSASPSTKADEQPSASPSTKAKVPNKHYSNSLKSKLVIKLKRKSNMHMPYCL